MSPEDAAEWRRTMQEQQEARRRHLAELELQAAGEYNRARERIPSRVRETAGAYQRRLEPLLDLEREEEEALRALEEGARPDRHARAVRERQREDLEIQLNRYVASRFWTPEVEEAMTWWEIHRFGAERALRRRAERARIIQRHREYGSADSDQRASFEERFAAGRALQGPGGSLGFLAGTYQQHQEGRQYDPDDRTAANMAQLGQAIEGIVVPRGRRASRSSGGGMTLHRDVPTVQVSPATPRARVPAGPRVRPEMGPRTRATEQRYGLPIGRSGRSHSRRARRRRTRARHRPNPPGAVGRGRSVHVPRDEIIRALQRARIRYPRWNHMARYARGEALVRALLELGSIPEARRFSSWEVGQIGSAATDPSQLSRGIDLFGAPRSARRVSAVLPADGSAYQSLPREHSRYDFQTRRALAAAPFGVEVKTGGSAHALRSTQTPEGLVNRWISFINEPRGQAVATRWVREGRIHPNWLDRAWVRAEGENAFRVNRMLVVISEGGVGGVRSTHLTDGNYNLPVRRISIEPGDID